MGEITSGRPGERPIREETVAGVYVCQMPDDALADRVSLGAPHGRAMGGYVVFRGSPARAIELLQQALAAVRSLEARADAPWR